MTATYNGPTTKHLENGTTYSLRTQNMTGRRYKDLNDRAGVPDTRIMLWKEAGNPALKVYETEADIAQEWTVKVDW